MAKEKKKEEYVELNGVLGNAFDYHVYHMQLQDYLIAWLIAVVLAVVVVMIFFGSIILSAVVAVLLAVKAPVVYATYRKKQRLKALRGQFKDLLESLSASYSAGRNTPDAFADARNDMVSIYGDDSDIVRELDLICTGLNNNINIEVLLTDFAQRSGLDDVMSFASVFEVCNRQGGDLKRVVNQTRDVISDKMEIEMEIDTMIAGNKNELNIMMVMPLLIMGMMKFMGLTSVGSNTPVNIAIKVVCIGIFAAAYAIGTKVTDIKI